MRAEECICADIDSPQKKAIENLLSWLHGHAVPQKVTISEEGEITQGY